MGILLRVVKSSKWTRKEMADGHLEESPVRVLKT